MPPQTFPGLKIFPKCVCRPCWGALSQTPIWIRRGGEGKVVEGETGVERMRGERRDGKGEEGRELK